MSIGIGSPVLVGLTEALTALCARGFGATDASLREEARQSVARALSVLLAAERSKTPPSPEDAAVARAAIQAVLKFVDDRLAISEAVQERLVLQKRRGTLRRFAIPASLPIEADLWTTGDPSRQVDWWSLGTSTPSVVHGVLGSILVDTVDTVVIAAALAGALSVARKGIGRNLTASRTHLVLDTTLKDVFSEQDVLVPAVAWLIDVQTMKLEVASAGHRSLWHIRNGVFQTIRVRPGSALGIEPTERCRPVELSLLPGDHLVAMTHGVFEMEDASGRAPKESDLRVGLLRRMEEDPRPTAAEHLKRVLRMHTGRDDWDHQATVISMEVR